MLGSGQTARKQNLGASRQSCQGRLKEHSTFCVPYLDPAEKILSRLPADPLPKLFPLAFDRSWSGRIARNPAAPRCVDISANLRQADLHFAVKRRLCPRS